MLLWRGKICFILLLFLGALIHWGLGVEGLRQLSATATLHQLHSSDQQILALTQQLRGGGGGEISVVRQTVKQFNDLFHFVSGSTTACWVTLLLSILLEGCSTSLSKHARDTGRGTLLLAALGLYTICMLGFFVSLAQIEVSIAYACWSALGTLIVSTMGIIFFNESAHRIKLLCLAMIAAGVVGLNLYDDS